ncbi:hypothetical protein [Natronobacterium haloterrestre]|uniref:hypothetical protein n=1 Tax=Natronobacterium haloterrestre TaxID=148448 RepID=UPI001160A478|nr:hypothetical protein [Halobiforma haloterrestris]
MEFNQIVPILGLPMLLMTTGVAYDAHKRNKYATPWFLLVSVIGLFGVLFYYITIRTEERAESLPAPPKTVRYLTPGLAVLGAVLLIPSLAVIAAETSESGLGYLLFVFPAIAIGITLSLELNHEALKKQRLFAEFVYILSLGVFTLLVAILAIFNQPADWMLLIPVLIVVALLIGWYRSRTPRILSTIVD